MNTAPQMMKPSGPVHLNKRSRDRRQLRRDRITAGFVLLLFALIFGWLMWLAGNSVPVEINDYWMMP